MRIAPAIAALRDDAGAQRRAQAAMQAAWDRWRREGPVASLLEQLERFGAGQELEACPFLDEMFASAGPAERLTVSLVDGLCAAMKANPLAQPPFRHGFNGHGSTILLAQSGRAKLLLQAAEPGRLRYSSATYCDALRHEAVIAGKGSGRILRIFGSLEQVEISEERVVLRPGARFAFDCGCEIMLVEDVQSRLVTLRLEQLSANPRPSREYCRRSGNLLHQAAGSLATSRREMMIALLGRMGRKEAAPVMAEVALSEHDESLRWQALRECLALDTARGVETLSVITGDAGDSLAEPAAALRAQLIEAYPQLLGLEGD